MHRHLIGLLVVHLILGPVSSTVVSAEAQARISAVATDVSPVYLRPDGTLPPLRTAAPGTRFVVVKESGEWVHVGIGLITLEAASDCHYGDFDYCSDEDQAILVGATAMTGVGVALWGAGAAANARAARRSALRPQLQYSFRF